MKVFWLTAIISFFAISALAQNGKISGKVTFGSDNAVLHQVSVQLVQLKRSTVTNDSGAFEFASVPPGKYTVPCSSGGV
jgi:hypothetical protein